MWLWQGRKVIKDYGIFKGKTPKNILSLEAPVTTLQKNSREQINMKEFSSLVGQTVFYSAKISPECSFVIG